MASRRYCVLARCSSSSPYSVIVEIRNENKALLIESSAIVTLEGDESAPSSRDEYQKVADGYGLLGILRLSHDESYLLVCTGLFSMGQLYGNDIYRVTSVHFVPLMRPMDIMEPRISDLQLQQFTSSGIFYFASSSDPSQAFDLTISNQSRISGETGDLLFFWNRNLHIPFQRYGIDSNEWCLRLICGSVQIRAVYIGSKIAKVAIASRLSCNRVGTRFNVRGVNDDGYVANFIETEQIISYEGKETSFIQIRGSVPLFWEQPGINVGSHKVKMRLYEICSPAYDRHLKLIKKPYGGITIVNLLGSKMGESILSDAYKMRHKNSNHTDVNFISFDYHAEVKASKSSTSHLIAKIMPNLNAFSYFHSENGADIQLQTGVIRTNCLDCLDRTNSVQTLIGIQMLPDQYSYLSIEASKTLFARFEEVLKELWQKNGDFCSVIYSGTGALEGKSKLKDASRSIARTIQNNLMDSSKQESFDLFLHGTLTNSHVHDKLFTLFPGLFYQGSYLIHECSNVVQSIVERNNEFIDEVPLKIFAGTWNVNGGKNMHNIAFRNQTPLSEWFFEGKLVDLEESADADIFVIGLEEIVDLNASNIMKASTTNQRLWCDGIRKVLCEKNEKYLLLGSEQLVGVCLFVFIKPWLSSMVRDVAIDSVKTGMGGATGNKGSVAIRFNVFSTSICFVCSHFAAGQNEVRDRNEDYKSALRKLHFPMGRDILSHDAIIWLGDFNYRISLPGDEAKKAIRSELYSQLVPNDQLTQQRLSDNIFVGFKEGELNFAPTYKYDTFSDDYDTSEKCRVPAWTDRILWRDSGDDLISLLSYGRVELKTSDHRPIRAFFKVKTKKVIVSKCQKVVDDVISCSGPPDSTILVSVIENSRFPLDIKEVIIERLSMELGINVLLSKMESSNLWLVMESGEMAIAALSLHDISINGLVLNVRLRTPNWTDIEGAAMAKWFKKFERVEVYKYVTSVDDEDFDFDDDEDDTSSGPFIARDQSRSDKPVFQPASDEPLCARKELSLFKAKNVEWSCPRDVTSRPPLPARPAIDAYKNQLN